VDLVALRRLAGVSGKAGKSKIVNVLTVGRRQAMLRAQSASLVRLWGEIGLSRQSSNQVTELLARWGDGDPQALETLMPLVYEELRRLASSYLRRERDDHTLQSTALVHEAYLRLVGGDAPHLQNRCHFFGVAAHLMRQILVDHARNHQAAKRGGPNSFKLTLDPSLELAQDFQAVDLIALDSALERLSTLDPEQSRVVELRFFAGLTIEDTSEVLGISPATVKRYWTTARAWLHREIAGGAPA
jgi:RNA polymerase sigma factor (TIGR02999 family)